MNSVVYTSLPNFKYGKKRAKSYKALNKDLVLWIEETTQKLIESRNKSELKAGEELKVVIPTIEKQVFFRIHGRCYFLDYYYPSKRIAIEIDGGYHKERKEKDRQRDKDFSSIDIATIRIKDKDVLKDRFLDRLNEEADEINKHKSKKKSLKKEQKKIALINSAMKRLREHDKKKQYAYWI